MANLTTIINWLKTRKHNKAINNRELAKANGIAAHVQNATIGPYQK